MEPQEILQLAISQGVDSFYVGFSGGKDSVVVADIAATKFPKQFKGAIYCDTGIKIDETYEFVKSYCAERGWPLQIVHPKRTFETMILENGFPGAAQHNITMRYLKYAPMRKWVLSRYKEGETPAVLSGVRKAESSRRKMNASEPIYRDSRLIFVSPIIDQSDSWTYSYFTEHKLKKSPVYNTMHISGDCLCGCYSKPGEAKLLDIFHPQVAQQIARLEDLLKEKGSKEARKYPTWGKQAGMHHAMEQDLLEKFTCSECYYDRADDSKEFLQELDAIENKISSL